MTEVAFAQVEQGQKKLDAIQEERIKNLWRKGSPIELVELFQLITEKARDLMRAALEKGWSLKPADAIHLATADHFHVAEFQTYDPALRKYELLTDTKFPIIVPATAQPMLTGLGVTTAPTNEAQGATTEAQQAKPAETTDTTAVSGSGSGLTEGATSNVEGQEKEQTADKQSPPQRAG